MAPRAVSFTSGILVSLQTDAYRILNLMHVLQMEMVVVSEVECSRTAHAAGVIPSCDITEVSHVSRYVRKAMSNFSDYRLHQLGA